MISKRDIIDGQRRSPLFDDVQCTCRVEGAHPPTEHDPLCRRRAAYEAALNDTSGICTSPHHDDPDPCSKCGYPGQPKVVAPIETCPEHPQNNGALCPQCGALNERRRTLAAVTKLRMHTNNGDRQLPPSCDIVFADALLEELGIPT